MTVNGEQVRQSEAAHVLQVYRRAPIVLVRGAGSRIWDADGVEYLDFISGVGVAALGHANPGLAKVIAEQATVLLHTSNLFFHPFQAELAEKLSRLSGLDRVFFCNSGTEAVEACLKFARRFWFTSGQPQRTKFVALTQAFHGRTFGSLSVTADPHYREPFGPMLSVTFVDPADPASLDAAVTSETAAIILEPIQGEGGVRPISKAFAAAVQAAAARTGALVIADEVQTGLGRTGHAFYAPVLGLQPDLVAVGKALGAGVPVGAALLRSRIADAVSPGDHGSTYGGNLLACRAGLYFVDQLLDGGLIDHVRRIGAHFEGRLRELASRQPMVKDVRGQGVMWGLELDRPASDVVDKARSIGLLVNGTSKTVVRLLPPLTVTEDEVNEAVTRLDAAMTAVAGGIPMTTTAIAQLRPHLAVTPGSSSLMRTARREDAAAINALITRYREAGRLLPRTEDEIARHADRFLVILDGEDVMGCAELARLSAKVAEVRSLVLDESLRGLGLGRLLVEQLTREARAGRLRGDLRVHARARHLRPSRVLARPPRLAPREDRRRLRELRAVPPLRSVGDAPAP